MKKITTTNKKVEKKLGKIKNEVLNCKKCSLYRTRTCPVIGKGSHQAKIIFIGEAPGASEDKTGRPFCGTAGQSLDELLNSIKLKREDIYMCNILKCLDGPSGVKTEEGWRRINWIYRHKYKGKVYCVNSKNQLILSNIVSSNRSLVENRKVYKLSLNHWRKSSNGLVGAVMTGDHYVLTNHGWRQIRDLKKKDKVHTGCFLHSQETYEALIGTMFGDATINRKSNTLAIVHSWRQKDYLIHLAALFNREDKIKKVLNKKYISFAFTVPANPCFRYLRDIFYRKGKKKIIPETLKNYSLISLAYHFMDDGYLRIRPPRNPSAEIATLGFEIEGLKLLSRKIKSLGINNYIRRYRICFNTKETEKLSILIAPYIPKCMNYKLIPKHWQIKKHKLGGRPIPFYDTFQLIRRKPDYKYVYDIEVEKYHNFLTRSGIVHNCRPPGNRGPQPEEIEACSPYLLRQIGIIKPKIICTLGNYATAFLMERYGLKDKIQGISKIHGKIFEIKISWGLVRIISLYHPAVVIYNRDMKVVLKKDFRLLEKFK